MKRRSLPTLALLCCLLSACDRQGPEGPHRMEEGRALQEAGDSVEAVELDPDAAHVGSAIDRAGDILEPADRFLLGQTVYVSVPTRPGLRDGQRVHASWFHDDGVSRQSDTRTVKGPFTVFQFIPRDAGTYNVEVAASNRPIALVQFEVQ